MNEAPARPQSREETLLEIPASQRASKTPLPGPLYEAFAGDELKLHGFNLREPVAADYIIFEKLASPVREQIVKGANEEEPTASAQDSANLVFQFTRPAKECLKVLKSGGREAFEDAANDLCERIHLSQLLELAQAIGAIISRSNSTLQTHEVKGDKKDEVPFLSSPRQGSPQMA